MIEKLRKTTEGVLVVSVITMLIKIVYDRETHRRSSGGDRNLSSNS